MAELVNSLIRDKRNAGVAINGNAKSLDQVLMNDFVAYSENLGCDETYSFTLNQVPVADSEITNKEITSSMNSDISKKALSLYLKNFYSMYVDSDSKYRLGQVIAEKGNPEDVLKSSEKGIFNYNTQSRLTRYTTKDGLYYTPAGWTLEDGDEKFCQVLFPPFKDNKAKNIQSIKGSSVWNSLVSECCQDLRTGLNSRKNKFTYRKMAYKALNDTIMLMQWAFARAFGVISTYTPEWDISLYIQEGLISDTYGTQPTYISLMNRFDQDAPKVINSYGQDQRNSIFSNALNTYSARVANFAQTNAAVSYSAGMRSTEWNPAYNVYSHFWKKIPDATYTGNYSTNCVYTGKFYDWWDSLGALKPFFDESEFTFQSWFSIAYDVNKTDGLTYRRPYSQNRLGKSFYNRLKLKDAEDLALSAYRSSYLKNYNVFYINDLNSVTPVESTIDDYALGLHLKVDLINDILSNLIGYNFNNPPVASALADGVEDLPEAIKDLLSIDNSTVDSTMEGDNFRKRSGGFLKSKITAALKNAIDAITFLGSKNSKAAAGRKKVDKSTSSGVTSALNGTGVNSAEYFTGNNSTNDGSSGGNNGQGDEQQTNPLGIDCDLEECAVTTGIPQHNPTFFGGPHGADLDPRTFISYGQVDNSVLGMTVRANVDISVRDRLSALNRNVSCCNNESNQKLRGCRYLDWTLSDKINIIKKGVTGVSEPMTFTYSGRATVNYLIGETGTRSHIVNNRDFTYTAESNFGTANACTVYGYYDGSNVKTRVNATYIGVKSQRWNGWVDIDHCNHYKYNWSYRVDSLINGRVAWPNHFNILYGCKAVTDIFARLGFGHPHYNVCNRKVTTETSNDIPVRVSDITVYENRTFPSVPIAMVGTKWNITWDESNWFWRFTCGEYFYVNHRLDPDHNYCYCERELELYDIIDHTPNKKAKLLLFKDDKLLEATIKAVRVDMPSGWWHSYSHRCHTDTEWRQKTISVPVLVAEDMQYIMKFPDTYGYRNCGCNIENFLDNSVLFYPEETNTGKQDIDIKTGLQVRSGRRGNYTRSSNLIKENDLFERSSRTSRPYHKWIRWSSYGPNGLSCSDHNHKDRSYGGYNKTLLEAMGNDWVAEQGTGCSGRTFCSEILIEEVSYNGRSDLDFYARAVSGYNTGYIWSNEYGIYLSGPEPIITKIYLPFSIQIKLYRFFNTVCVVNPYSFKKHRNDSNSVHIQQGLKVPTTAFLTVAEGRASISEYNYSYTEANIANFIDLAYWQCKYQLRGLKYIRDFFVSPDFKGSDVMNIFREYIPSKLRYLAGDPKVERMAKDITEGHPDTVKISDTDFVPKESLYEYNDWLHRAVSYFHYNDLSNKRTATYKEYNPDDTDAIKTKLAIEFDKYINYLQKLINFLDGSAVTPSGRLCTIGSGSTRLKTTRYSIGEIDFIKYEINYTLNQISQIDNPADYVFAYMNVLYEARKQFINFRANKQDGTLAMCASLERALPMVAAGSLKNPNFGTTASPTVQDLDNVKIKFYDVVNSAVAKIRALENKEPLPEDTITYVYSPVTPATYADYKADVAKRSNNSSYEPEVIIYPKWSYKRNDNGIVMLDAEKNPIKVFNGQFGYCKKPIKGEYMLISDEFKKLIDKKPSHWLVDWGLTEELGVNLKDFYLENELGSLEIVCNINPIINASKLAKLASSGISDIQTLLCGSQEGQDYWKIPVLAKELASAKNYKTNIELIPYEEGATDTWSFVEKKENAHALMKDLLYPIVKDQNFDTILNFEDSTSLINKARDEIKHMAGL